MLRIALIGAGRTVSIGHAPALSAMGEQFNVVAVADQSLDALNDIGIQLGIPPSHRYADYRMMLMNEEIDVVSISLPHAFHYEATMAALDANLHVITERPLALSVQDAIDLVRRAERKGLLITVMHYYLFYPPFHRAIRAIADGQIGEPFFVRCEGVTGGYGPGTAAYHPEWHADPEIAGGGVWVDSGYHNVYLCEALLGSPVSAVAARIGTFTTKLEVDDTAVALLTHANGTISNVQAAWSVPSGGHRVVEIYGSEGTLAFDHEGHSFGIFSNASQTWHHIDVTVQPAEIFVGLYHPVFACLPFGAAPPVG